MKKFKVIENSRFLEKNGMIAVSGGSCPGSGDTYISCGPTDSRYMICYPTSTYSSCAISKDTCTNCFWMDCVNNMITCGGGQVYRA